MDIQKLLSDATPTDQIKSGLTGRPYSVIAKKDGIDLLMNVDFGPGTLVTEHGMGGGFFMTLRFAEKKTINSPVYAFATRKTEDTEDDGLFRYEKVNLGVCVIPAPTEFIRLKWEEQSVTAKTVAWINSKVVVSNATPAISDEALEYLINAFLDNHPTPSISPFKLPS